MGKDEATRRTPPAWWERRAVLLAVILLGAVPFLFPAVPPLVDLLGHMGRYRVELDLGTSPFLHRYYDFKWVPIGNLGVDLLVYPLAKLIGLEPAVKLIVVTIPVLTVIGMLWVAREVHRRIPPTAFLALPFVLGHPFLFGFVNFALSIALAFLAFGLWLRMARKHRFRSRALIFVPISFVLYFCHTFGWGMLGLMCFSAEAVRQHDEGQSWWKAGLHAVPHAAVMAGPVVLILIWRGEVSQDMTHGWFEWQEKLIWVRTALRDRWRWLDLGMTAFAVAAIATAIFTPRLSFSRHLGFSALVLFAAFMALPYTLFGSAYADMRIVPYFLAVALLAIRPRPGVRLGNAGQLAAVALAFWFIKVAATTISLGIAAVDQTAKMEALNHIPRGARLVSMASQACNMLWALPRNSHLPSMALERREAFANDQWAIEGTNLLRVTYVQAGRFRNDWSQWVKDPRCRLTNAHPINESLRDLPRDAFDYLWLIDPPAYDQSLVADMQPVWRGKNTILYRIKK